MNADRLMAHFERISDAPDAVSTLRRFVLDLAVTGRLLPSVSSAWETKPITDCLEPLADGRLIHQGWSPQCKSTPSASSRIWGVLKTTAIQEGRFAQEHQKELPSHLTPKSVLEVRPLDLLITCAGPRARCGVACLVESVRPHLMISGKMYRFRTLADVMSPHYLLLVLRSKKTQAVIDAMKTGSSESGLNLTKERFARLTITYGALAEQRRIVAKVDELMKLCDQLEASQAERESRRDRLVVASLNRLSQPTDPDEFKKDAGFTLSTLNRLSTKPEHIKELRKTILNLAVRGKLVPQDVREGTAEELLDDIQKSRASTGSNGRRFTDQGTDALATDEPYTLPSSWIWTAFSSLITHSDSGWSPKTEGFPRSGKEWGVLKVSAVSWDVFRPDENKQLLPGVTPPDTAVVHHGDFLISRANTSHLIARCVIVKEAPLNLIMSDKIVRLHLVAECNPFFFKIVNNDAGHARDYYAAKATGTSLSMKNVSRDVIYRLPIPLPPLAEQKRIVAKVDELMGICDQLETQLESQQKGRRQLLEALLHEALEGVG